MSPWTAKTRAIGFRHHLKRTFRTKMAIAEVMKMAGTHQTAAEIRSMGRQFGLFLNMQDNTINSVCSDMERQGVIFSTQRRGLGNGGFPAAQYVLHWSLYAGPLDPQVIGKRVRDPEPYPAADKQAINGAIRKPALWTEDLRRKRWEHEFEVFMAEMAMEQGEDF